MSDIKYGKLENSIIIEYPKNKDDENCILLDNELYQYCLSLGQVEFNGAIDDRIYTINDKDLFAQCEIIIEELGVQEQGLEEIALDYEYRLSKIELGV